jgi:CHAD domain-containing protein
MPAAAIAGMHAHERAHLALGKEIAEHVCKLEKRVAKAKKKGDEESIHDTRTALRRVREDLVVLGRPWAAKVEDQLHDVEKSLALTRDADIVLRLVRDYEREHPRDSAELAELVARLKRQRKKGRRRARATLARTKPALGRVMKRLDADDDDGSLVRHLTRELVWKGYDEVLAFELQKPLELDVLHHFRAACRRLRYELELFAAALPEAKSIVAELREVQESVGEMHDDHVAAELASKWMTAGKLAANPAIDRFIDHEARAAESKRPRAVGLYDRILSTDFRRALAAALEREAA